MKNIKKSFEKKHVKGIKIFLKKEKTKGKKKKTGDRYQNLSEEERECNKNNSEEEKGKKVEYMRNYYLAHKK